MNEACSTEICPTSGKGNISNNKVLLDAVPNSPLTITKPPPSWHPLYISSPNNQQYSYRPVITYGEGDGTKRKGRGGGK